MGSCVSIADVHVVTSSLVVLLAMGQARADDLKWGADAQGGAPYVFEDPTDPNRLVGFEVELAGLLAQRVGQRATLVHGPWANLLELLARGDFDVALNGIEVTAEKRSVVALSHPYFAAAEVLTVRKGDVTAPRSKAQLAGHPVGTLPGSLAERIARDAGAVVRTYDGGQNDLYDDLKVGRIDAVLADEPIAAFYGDLEPSLERVPGDFGVVSYALALRPDDATRLQALDAALDALVADGTLRALYEKWGLWNPQVAALLHDPRLEARGAPLELDRWKAAVGKLPPFLERVRTRYPAMLPLFLEGAALTLATSLLAMALAVLLGVSLALSRRHGPAPLRWLAVAYTEFFRGTPLLIQLTMIYFGLPELGVKLDPFVAGVLALGLNYAAAEAENYRAGLESVPSGQHEAATVLGLSTAQTLRHVIAPQALRIALPPMTNDFIALLKDSSLVSIVTLTELTKTYVNLASSTRDHLGLGVLVAGLYLLLGLPFARLARLAERWFGRHLEKGANA